jgi:hypothetical protein
MNGDGYADLLVRNYLTGSNRVLFMSGLQQQGAAVLPAVTGTGWQIGGVGDFNGDRTLDVVWRHSATGRNALWYLTRAQVIASVPLPVVSDTNWWIVAVAR